jgi:hypothetical protein
MTTLSEARGHRRINRNDAFVADHFVAALLSHFELKRVEREARRLRRKANKELALKLRTF